MAVSTRIVDSLGGPRVFRGRVRTVAQLRQLAERGLPYASLTALRASYAISVKEMSAILAVPERTLARRKAEGRFAAGESDRLFRLGRIAALAEELLGTREKAASWLHRPNRALGGAPPLSRLGTDLGAREVEDVLLRIAHGVYS